MSERVKSQSAGPATGDVFESDTQDGYLAGYEGREFEETTEHRADFGDGGDWGRQGEWGVFSNRPGSKEDQSWAVELGSDLKAEK